jgi:hypothetical protein
MDKKFYVTPEMEEADIEMVTYMESYSSGIHWDDEPASDDNEEP